MTENAEFALNVLGAVTLAMADELRADTEVAAALGAAGPAALISISDEPGCTVDALAQTVGVTHSGALRLADRLQAGGLLERETVDRPRVPGRRGPGQTVGLRLTPAGERAASRVLTARQGVLAAAAGVLDDVERENLSRLLTKVLSGLVRSRQHADAICRLCDKESCPHDRCPVERGVEHRLSASSA